MRGNPLAQAAAQLGAGDRDVERDHDRRGEVEDLPQHAHGGAHGLAGKIGDPRPLHVLHDLAAQIVHLRQFELCFLGDERGELVVQVRQSPDHRDELLHEHVAEQAEQHNHDDEESHETGDRRHRTLPPVLDQAYDERFDRKRKEERDDDVEDNVGDLAPRGEGEPPQIHSDHGIEQRPPIPFGWPARIALRREQRIDVQFLLIVRALFGHAPYLTTNRHWKIRH